MENPKNTDTPTENDEDHIPMLNQYVITVDVGETGGTSGQDFDDADPEKVTVTAESSDPATVSVAYAGKKVTLTGHQATKTDPATPVTITIKAVDSGGLPSIETLTASVTVTGRTGG